MREIRELFSKAAFQHEAAFGLNESDWMRYREIQDDAERLQRFEMRLYRLEYATRLELARKSLIGAAGSKPRKFAPRFLGRDNFDKSAIDRQAHRLVHAQHEQALARLEEAKSDRIRDLLASAQARQNVGRQMKHDFAQATDRRSGIERRRGPPR